MKPLNAYEQAIVQRILDGKSAAEISAALAVPHVPLLEQTNALFHKLAASRSRRTPYPDRAK